MQAGGDVIVSGGTSANRTILSTNGHRDNQSFAGDGGDQELIASGNVTIGQYSRLDSNGASPDGFGGSIEIVSGGNTVIGGNLRANALGTNGAAGIVDVSSAGSVEFQTTSLLEVTGGAGFVALYGSSGLTFSGTAELSGGANGFLGALFAESDASTVVYGDINNGGAGSSDADSDVEILGCSVRLEAGASISTGGVSGANKFIGREQITFSSGSAVSASQRNDLVYRNLLSPPVIQGTVTPSPVTTLNPDLPPCP
jgi:hypothetical protein